MKIMLITALTLMVSGCALNPESPQSIDSNAYPPTNSPDRQAAQPMDSRQTAPTKSELPRFADAKPVEYVLVRARAVGVTNATDDQQNTYIGFSSLVPSDLVLFDSSGRRLEACTSGRVVGVKGVHEGILLRIGQLNSYVAKNPGSIAVRTYALADDPDVVAVRNEIEMVSGQMKAFQEAIRKADQNMENPNTSPAPSSAPVENVADALPTQPPGPNDTYGVLDNGTVLVRVFFAFGSKAVVRPDDGLLRLELEAKQAGAIRLVGYTDSVGSPQLNRALAKSRVDAIANFLVSRGVPRQKISVQAAGETDFLASNRTWRGRAANRRVEAMFTPNVASR
ncbi:MAG: OmpA family protein [Paracoccaceae bacterium]